MSSDSETEAFIRAAFGSVWALELLLILREAPDRDWTRAELIASLRASDHVLSRSLADLRAMELVQEEGDNVRYAPGAPHEVQLGRAVALYESRPTFVRRLIVGGPQDSVERFADAFKFRRD
ncbi:hypothetical protein [Sphingomonas sp.]|jgi:hypothetical protein|uniref:hypothetical protein n=1 Tax=Sphingomonas sp. TaxID=28214 RepID=UPI002DF09A35|nr:hypothetical protein [Sphingomonas sp.]